MQCFHRSAIITFAAVVVVLHAALVHNADRAQRNEAMATARSSIGGGAAWARAAQAPVYAETPPLDREQLTLLAQTPSGRAADMMDALEQAYQEGAAAADSLPRAVVREQRQFFKQSTFEHQIGLRMAPSAGSYVDRRIGVAVSGSRPLPRTTPDGGLIVRQPRAVTAAAASREGLSLEELASRHEARATANRGRLASGWASVADRSKKKSEKSGGWWAREEAQQASAEAAYNAKVDAAWKEIDEMEADKDGQPQ